MVLLKLYQSTKSKGNDGGSRLLTYTHRERDAVIKDLKNGMWYLRLVKKTAGWNNWRLIKLNKYTKAGYSPPLFLYSAVVFCSKTPRQFSFKNGLKQWENYISSPPVEIIVQQSEAGRKGTLRTEENGSGRDFLVLCKTCPSDAGESQGREHQEDSLTQ